MRKLVVICTVAATVLAIGSTAFAGLSWQTTPILGTDVSDATGDVVVITGPQPMNGDVPYLDVDGNPVLGPTIPHYSMVGDPLYGIGSPSMDLFVINPNQYIDGHWTDLISKIAFGSGINVEVGHTYHWTSVWTYLGSLQPTYDIPSQGDYFAPESEGGFVMLKGYINNMWAEDMGQWKYTETWTDLADASSITYTANFEVVPEPATMALLGLGALSLIRRKK